MSPFEVFVCVSGILFVGSIWGLGHFLTRDKVVTPLRGENLVTLCAKD